jgi:L-threonylcarbamoyladenylate synthase
MAVSVVGDTGDPLPAPGMLARHYAPRAPLECSEGDAAERVQQLGRAGERVGWLRLSRGHSPTVTGLTLIDMPSDPAAYAARLYAELHALDAAGATRIVVDMPPDEEAWLAVRDRLRRAAS